MRSGRVACAFSLATVLTGCAGNPAVQAPSCSADTSPLRPPPMTPEETERFVEKLCHERQHEKYRGEGIRYIFPGTGISYVVTIQGIAVSAQDMNCTIRPTAEDTLAIHCEKSTPAR